MNLHKEFTFDFPRLQRQMKYGAHENLPRMIQTISVGIVKGFILSYYNMAEECIKVRGHSSAAKCFYIVEECPHVLEFSLSYV